MRHGVLVVLLVVAGVVGVYQPTRGGDRQGTKYKPEWSSLRTLPVPAWFDDIPIFYKVPAKKPNEHAYAWRVEFK